MVHIVAEPPAGVTLIDAAEFAIDNLPTDQCLIAPHWNNFGASIGELGTGIAVDFNPPLEGPPFDLGTLEFVVFEPLGDDYVIHVVPADNGLLHILDQNADDVELTGGHHTFNCTAVGECTGSCRAQLNLLTALDGDCYQDAEVLTTPVEASSFGAVKALY